MRKRQIDEANHTTYGSLRKFQEAGKHPSGILTVMNGGLPIDLRHDPRGFDTTTVFFHGAVSNTSAYRFPFFSGVGISEDLPTNRVFIADPSLYINDRLMLGWYAGNKMQPRLQWVIRAIINALVPKTERLVTFGSSGGGFAALYYAFSRDGATAVPVNPQTSIGNYLPFAIDLYTTLGWGVSGDGALPSLTAVTDLTKLYSTAASRVFYVQNRNDNSHVTRHYEPFVASLPAGHEVSSALVDGPAGHAAPDKAVIRAALSAAVAGESSLPHLM